MAWHLPTAIMRGDALPEEWQHVRKLTKAQRIRLQALKDYVINIPGRYALQLKCKLNSKEVIG